MTFLSEFHGVSDEVGNDLLYAANVDNEHQAGNGIVYYVFDEDDIGILHPVLYGEANIVEGFNEVYWCFFYRSEAINHRRCMRNVGDEPFQHVTAVLDDSHIFCPICLSVKHVEDTSEADNGVEGRAQLVAEEYIEPTPEQENLNLNDLSRQMLVKALERNNGNRSKAAQELGISDRTLYRRLKQYGLAK